MWALRAVPNLYTFQLGPHLRKLDLGKCTSCSWSYPDTKFRPSRGQWWNLGDILCGLQNAKWIGVSSGEPGGQVTGLSQPIHMIWYIWLQLGSHPVAVVQFTLTHKQYIKQHNRHKQYTEKHNRHKQYTEKHNRHKQYAEQHSSLIRKSADRAPSLRGIPWHMPYNWGKSTEKPQLG